MPATAKPPVDQLTKEVGRVVEVAMDEAGETAVSLAPKVGISHSQLSRMLAGKRHIDIWVLTKLCAALGVEMMDVLREADEVSRARLRARIREGGRTAPEQVLRQESKDQLDVIRRAMGA